MSCVASDTIKVTPAEGTLDEGDERSEVEALRECSFPVGQSGAIPTTGVCSRGANVACIARAGIGRISRSRRFFSTSSSPHLNHQPKTD
jgi:hypothetical protein